MCNSVPQWFNNIKSHLTCGVPKVLQVPVDHINNNILQCTLHQQTEQLE